MLKKLTLTVLWRSTRPSGTNTQKRCPFHHRGLECKSGQPRDAWINGQIWHQSTKWSRAKANTVFPTECSDHSKYPLPTTQETTLHMGITRWSILKSDWSYSFQLQIESSIQSAKSRLGADCGSDHELLIAKFRFKLKKGKINRPFRYDLNQIPYNDTVGVTNRFKGLDLIKCVKNYGQRFMTLYRTQWSRPSPRRRNTKKQSLCLRRP